jgi:hypothetical protein
VGVLVGVAVGVGAGVGLVVAVGVAVGVGVSVGGRAGVVVFSATTSGGGEISGALHPAASRSRSRIRARGSIFLMICESIGGKYTENRCI